jgi:hypothetical protein
MKNIMSRAVFIETISVEITDPVLNIKKKKYLFLNKKN